MKKIIATILIFSQCACSIVVPHSQTITISTSERDAKIYVNGEYIGQGRVDATVPRKENVAIIAKKTGFITAQKNIDYKLSATGTLDAIGTLFFLFPIVGLVFPGAWVADQSNVTILLEEK